MRNLLVIRLHHTSPTYFEWIAFDKKTKKSISSSDMDLNALLDGKIRYQIIVLAPGVDVYLTEISLPKMSPSLAKKAISFALAEELASDISNVHFTIGKATPNNTYPVAAINKYKLQSWVNYIGTLFSQQSIFITYILPDMLTLPWSPEKWTIHTENEMAFVRIKKDLAFSIETDTLGQILPLYLNFFHEKHPKTIEWASNTAAPDNITSSLKKLNITFQKINSIDSILQLMVYHIDESGSLNLLENQENPFLKKQLSIFAVILAFGCVLIFSLGLIIQLSILEHQHNVLKINTEKKIRALLPMSKSLVNPVKQIQNEIIYLRDKQYPRGNFFNLLEVIAPNISSGHILSLEYANHIVILRIALPNSASLSKIKNALLQHNIIADVLQMKKEENQIELSLRIQERAN